MTTENKALAVIGFLALAVQAIVLLILNLLNVIE